MRVIGLTRQHEHDIDIREGRQFTTPITTDRDQRNIAAAIAMPTGLIMQNLQNQIDAPCLHPNIDRAVILGVKLLF